MSLIDRPFRRLAILALGMSVYASAPVAAQSPGARDGGGMVYDPVRKEMVLYGGFSRATESLPSDLWAWNGTSWRRLVPTDGVEPAGRLLPHMAYDAARQRIVMFGGRRQVSNDSVEIPGEMWEWDGTRWHRITSDSMPVLHALVLYDPARRQVIVQGGLNARGILSEIRGWDGRAWHLIDSAGPYGNTIAAAGAVTPAGELILVTEQSGRSSDSVAMLTWTRAGRTWTRRELGPAMTNLQPTATAPDGTIYIYQKYGEWLTAPLVHTRSPAGVWTTVAPPSPPAKGFAAAVPAYDSDRKRFVIYSDVFWEWDGARWVRRP